MTDASTSEPTIDNLNMIQAFLVVTEEWYGGAKDGSLRLFNTEKDAKKYIAGIEVDASAVPLTVTKTGFLTVSEEFYGGGHWFWEYEGYDDIRFFKEREAAEQFIAEYTKNRHVDMWIVPVSLPDE